MIRHAFNEIRENPGVAALAVVGCSKGLYEMFVKPARPATKAWAALGAMVVAYEAFCPSGETLSEGADRAIEKHPFITKGIVGLLALHVANFIPPGLDPLHQAFIKLKGAT